MAIPAFLTRKLTSLRQRFPIWLVVATLAASARDWW